jgi:mevalonate kinase
VPETYYSNGKILLTGEYAVMYGAKALAFPLKYGQTMSVRNVSGDNIVWNAFSTNNLWFVARYHLPDLYVEETNDMDKALFLKRLLSVLFQMAPTMMNSGYQINTNANFDVNWGFGTSSTLISDLAFWAKVNPFELFYAVSKGSGYDIACSRSITPIIFERNLNNPVIQSVNYDKLFTDSLYLVYSGKKKFTEKHLSEFMSQYHSSRKYIEKISAITENIVRVQTLDEFIFLLKEHERVTGQILQKVPVQKSLFIDFIGAIKSLGAWGGDFYLAATPEGPEYIQHYFEQFGLSVILSFEKTILN